MGNTKTTIELNGQVYNTRSGTTVDGPSGFRPSPRSNSSIDGFITPKPSVVQPQAPRPAKITHPVKPHTPQRPSTLMRSAVQKPTTIAVGTPDNPVKSNGPSLPTKIEYERLRRAKATPKSSVVSKFSSSLNDPVDITPPAPAAPVVAAPVANVAPAAPVVAPMPAQPAQSAGAELFTKALDNVDVNAAQPKAVKKPAGKGLKITASAIACLVVISLAGFGVYKNLPGIAVKVASTRADVNTSVPSYAPVGYSLNRSVGFEPGQVTLSYTTADGNKSYKVVQQNSSWNSQALLENYVATASPSYKTYQTGGKTIYIVGNVATWVSGGVWYTVTGDDTLNTPQLLRIADSL